MDAFAFEASEEVFGNSVVIGVTFAGHALADNEIRQPQTISVGGILDITVRMEGETGIRMISANGGIQSSKGKICVDTDGENVANSQGFVWYTNP